MFILYSKVFGQFFRQWGSGGHTFQMFSHLFPLKPLNEYGIGIDQLNEKNTGLNILKCHKKKWQSRGGFNIIGGSDSGVCAHMH